MIRPVKFNNLKIIICNQRSKRKQMSLVLHIEELIDTLFQHPSFQSKLKHFTESDPTDCSLTKLSKSIHTDISESLEDSQSKSSQELDAIATQIQQLLSQAYHKSTHPKFETIEICRIYEDIELLREQITGLKMQCQQLKNWLTSSKQETPPKLIEAEQFKKWQSEILEKIDIVSRRNLKKVQSIFADKLNSFQMAMHQRVQPNNKMYTESSLDLGRVPESAPQPEEKDSKIGPKQHNGCSESKEVQISKTLKAVKSLGSLLFKN